MLKIRFARAGRKKRPFFKIVVTEHTKPAQSGFIEKLGWYNPLTKEFDLNIEKVKARIANGAQLSPSVEKVIKAKNVTL